MVKQNYLFRTSQIIPTALHVEMERSYLEYAMSVIVGRALPDVRDGLKPVHRRILYAMHELGLTPDRPYRKCARVVGEVLGKYHPHGDRAVYEALVRMVQDFSCRYPLLAGHGNFGSLDDDPPAAMRYTETRLATIAFGAVLSEIGQDTVDFTSNFDNSQQEPVVLPAQLPILLLNGCSGIAVGMATNVPPHNLGEVVDGLIALIDKPELKDEKLWQLIPAPDFPTGGQIVDNSAIKDLYRTGRGIIQVRGVAKIEQIVVGKRRRHERNAIVISELPYQVNKAGWIEKLADSVNQGRIQGISDLRDESDRNGMRVVVELKRDSDPQTILGKIYQQTALETKFGAIMLALVENKPTQLSLRQILEEFLKFREQTLRRQYTYELEEAKKGLHLLEGNLIALNNLDEAIDILRNAPDGSTAKIVFQEKLGTSETQADSILAMPMRRLTGLERQKLEAQCQDLKEKIASLEKLLGDRQELMKALKKELRSLKRKFGDERRTRIIPESSVKITPKEVAPPKVRESSKKARTGKISTDNKPEKNAVVEITDRGYISWRVPENNKKTTSSKIKKDEDFVIDSGKIGTEKQLAIVTDIGKAYPLSILNIPPAQKSQKTTLMSLLPGSAQRDAKKTISHLFLPHNLQESDCLVLLTQKGYIKRLLASELSHLSNRGLSLIKFKEQDRLNYAYLLREATEVAIATTGGRVLRLEVNERKLPVMGRSAIGDRALRLRYGEQLVGCVLHKANDNFFLISQLGYGKRLSASAIRLSNCGDIGTQALHFTSKEDNLAGMVAANLQTKVKVLTTNKRIISLSLDSVPLCGKDEVGDRLVPLQTKERIVRVIPFRSLNY